MEYLVAYRTEGTGILELNFYHFTADNAEHAIEQFRDAEPHENTVVVFVVLV